MKLMKRGRSGKKVMMRETMRTMKSLPKMNMGKPTTKNIMGLTKGATIRRPIKLHISLNLDNMVVATVFKRMSLDFCILLILFDVLVFHNDMFVPKSKKYTYVRMRHAASLKLNMESLVFEII